MRTLQSVEYVTTECYNISYFIIQVLNHETKKIENYMIESRKADIYSSVYYKDMEAGLKPYLRIFENDEVIKQFYKGDYLKDLVTTLKEYDSYFKIYKDATDEF